MKFTTNKTNLLNTLQKVTKAVPLKAPMPILGGILFEVHNNYLTVTATNLDISIQCTAKVNGIRDGSIVLPAHYITEIVKRLPDTREVEVESNDLKTTLQYYASQSDTIGSQTVIQGFNSSSFPSFPSISNLKTLLTIKAKLLSEALKRVLFAVSYDESRPIFTGVLFQKNNFLKLVTTDTYRLVCKTLPQTGEETGEETGEAIDNVIIPGKNLKELVKILARTEEQDDVEIYLGDNQVFFVIKPKNEDEQEVYPTILVSRLIAGQFPLYQRIIPQKFMFSVCLNTQELKAAVERAMLFTQENTWGNISLVTLNFQQEKCVVSTQTEAGGIKENLIIGKQFGQSADGQDGFLEDERSICFNARYLVEALQVIPTEEVDFNISGPLSAMVIHPVNRHEEDTEGKENTEEPDYLSLLLPVRGKE